MIYFIQDGEDGPIKIGHSDDVTRRITELSTSTHKGLRLLLVISGEPEQEKELHERFDFAHKKGEWFWPVKQLLSFIDSHKLSIPLSVKYPMMPSIGDFTTSGQDDSTDLPPWFDGSFTIAGLESEDIEQ